MSRYEHLVSLSFPIHSDNEKPTPGEVRRCLGIILGNPYDDELMDRVDVFDTLDKEDE